MGTIKYENKCVAENNQSMQPTLNKLHKKLQVEGG